MSQRSVKGMKIKIAKLELYMSDDLEEIKEKANKLNVLPVDAQNTDHRARLTAKIDRGYARYKKAKEKIEVYRDWLANNLDGRTVKDAASGPPVIAPVGSPPSDGIAPALPDDMGTSLERSLVDLTSEVKVNQDKIMDALIPAHCENTTVTQGATSLQNMVLASVYERWLSHFTKDLEAKYLRIINSLDSCERKAIRGIQKTTQKAVQKLKNRANKAAHIAWLSKHKARGTSDATLKNNLRYDVRHEQCSMTKQCYAKYIYAAEENVLGSYAVNTTRVSIQVSTDDNNTPLSVESLRGDDASVPSLRNEYQDYSTKDDLHTKDKNYGSNDYYGGNDYYQGNNDRYSHDDDYGTDDQYGYDNSYDRDDYYGDTDGYVEYDNYGDDHGMDREHKSEIVYDKD